MCIKNNELIIENPDFIERIQINNLESISMPIRISNTRLDKTENSPNSNIQLSKQSDPIQTSSNSLLMTYLRKPVQSTIQSHSPICTHDSHHHTSSMLTTSASMSSNKVGFWRANFQHNIIGRLGAAFTAATNHYYHGTSAQTQHNICIQLPSPKSSPKINRKTYDQSDKIKKQTENEEIKTSTINLYLPSAVLDLQNSNLNSVQSKQVSFD